MRIFDPQSKVLANFDYIKQLLLTGNCPPVLVEVDPSNVCNHGCDFCLSSYVHAGKQMLSGDAMLKLCDDLVASKAKAVNWTGGGEPTVNPHLKKAISRLGQSSVKQGMFTNGTLLDRFDLFDTLANNLSWVRVSVDAGTAATYNRIRRADHNHGWDKMLSNLAALIYANNASGHKMAIGVGFVVTPGNVHDVLEFARVFRDSGVDYCQYKPEIVNIERDDSQRRGAFWRLAEVLLKEAMIILGDKFQLNQYKLEDLSADQECYGRTYGKCLGSQVSPCVGADGLVYVCTNYRGHPAYSYGSIHERSFGDIWNDVGRRQAVMNRIENVERFSFCTKLCKPHESNKMLWKLYSDYQASTEQARTLAEMEEQGRNVLVQHPEFI